MGDKPDVDTLVETLPGAVATTAEPVSLRGEERYLPAGVIGKGGMGVVNAQFDRLIGRRVACKELRPELGDDRETRKRFLREARVQGQLEHPAIVPVYDIGTRADGSPYFTMKSISGGVTLAEIIKGLAENDPALTAKYARHRLLAAFSRICLAIDYAHERGVLHRDLKPANLILGEYGEVYVLDWGLAKITNEAELGTTTASRDSTATQADSLLGTPGYMAPEQIDDPTGVGPAVDSYALGAILYELLALVPLHPRGFAALETTRKGVDARPPNAPPELEAAVVGATAKDPAQRLSARALSDAIERYLEGERDLELRRDKAASHARAADDAARAGLASGDLEARKRAMREINKAMALDPSNTLARTTMLQLFSEMPATTPEVEADIERRWRRNMQWISGVGAFTYTFLVLPFFAVFVWMGVRQWAPVLAFTGLMAATAVFSLIVWKRRDQGGWLVLAAVVASFLALAASSRFVSPLVVVPAVVAVNATAYAVFVRRGHRAIVIACAFAAILVPFALEELGVWDATFAIAGDRLTILPMALDLPRTPTLFMILAAACMGITMGTLIIGFIRDRLSIAERHLYLYNWQLRQLLEIEVPRSVTAARKSRG